ncbi:MAG: hypothetical protein IT562_19490 [Alphaproteobacteria bacterium]|nr:hypothetical protein [Alphaproteobacteria bacterium]
MFTIAIAVGRRGVQRWQAECARALGASGFGRIALIIEVDGTPPLRLPAGSRAGAEAGLDQLPAGAASLAIAAPPSDLDRIALAGHTLDLLLDLTGLRLGRSLPGIARLGVWAFHHGDPARYDGTGPGLDEIANGDLASCCLLYRDSGSGAVDVLREGWFRTRQTPRRDADSLLLRSARWPAIVLAGMAETRAAPSPLRSVVLPASVPRGASLATRLGAVCRVSAYAWESLGRRLRRERWSIGIADQPIEAVIREKRLAPLRWIAGQPDDRFYADPFPLRRLGDRLDILIESAPYAVARGRLALISVDGDRRLLAEADALVQPHHLSYPFILRDWSGTYIVPESWEADRLSAYQIAPDGTTLVHDRELMTARAIVDPTLLWHGGRWWLFCCDRHDDDVTNLFLFHAERWQGPYLPHPLNPVKTDVRSSRPAGAFIAIGNELYRPAQDCALRYGSAIAINRVVELDERRFREEVAFVLRPDPGGPFPHGLHTINGLDGLTVVDGARLSFEPAAALADRWARRRARVRRQ